jgi:hypothetical protein
VTDRRDLERGRPEPAAYGPEMHRYEFWKPHATPIPASLLNLTGWLGQNPSRLLPVERPEGPVPVPAKDIRPGESVLFRLDKPGTRERADWEAYFGWVTLLQAHEWTVEQLKAEARAKMAAIDEKIGTLATEREAAAREAAEDQHQYDEELGLLKGSLRVRAAERSQELPSSVLAGAFRDGEGGFMPIESTPRVPGTTGKQRVDRDSLQWVENARRAGLSLIAQWEGRERDFDRRSQRLRAERKPYELEIARLELEATRRVYAGLFARINAFLHVQALSAATIAIEEYRTNARPDSVLAGELEQRLAVE